MSCACVCSVSHRHDHAIPRTGLFSTRLQSPSVRYASTRSYLHDPSLMKEGWVAIIPRHACHLELMLGSAVVELGMQDGSPRHEHGIHEHGIWFHVYARTPRRAALTHACMNERWLEVIGNRASACQGTLPSRALTGFCPTLVLSRACPREREGRDRARWSPVHFVAPSAVRCHTRNQARTPFVCGRRARAGGRLYIQAEGRYESGVDRA